MRKFFNFLKNLLVLTCLIGVAWTYQDQIKDVAADWGSKLAGYLPDSLSTADLAEKTISENSKSTIKNTTGYTWSKKTATVYIDLKRSSQVDLYNATINAMAAWNQTGAFRFKQTSSKKKAKIVVVSAYKSDGAAGLTTYKYSSRKRRLYSAKVSLNTYYLDSSYYNYSQARIVNTVEHELGHAIGLDHRNGVTVMYPTGSLYTIQPKDIALVKKIYKGKKF